MNRQVTPGCPPPPSYVHLSLQGPPQQLIVVPRPRIDTEAQRRIILGAIRERDAALRNAGQEAKGRLPWSLFFPAALWHHFHKLEDPGPSISHDKPHMHTANGTHDEENQGERAQKNRARCFQARSSGCALQTCVGCSFQKSSVVSGLCPVTCVPSILGSGRI